MLGLDTIAHQVGTLTPRARVPSARPRPNSPSAVHTTPFTTRRSEATREDPPGEMSVGTRGGRVAPVGPFRQVFGSKVSRSSVRWRPGLGLNGRLLAVLFALFVGLSGGLGSFLLGPHAQGSGLGSSEQGELQVTSAAESLEAGQGPAAGSHFTCSSDRGASISCSGLSPSPAISLDSGKWSNLTTKVIPAPAPRESAMTWDAADGYALLFGGYLQVHGEQTYYGVSDTWTYLNGVWTNITNTVIGGAPPNVANPALAYDPFEGKVVLFGGGDSAGDDIDQTWTYLAGEWTNITNTAGTPPAPRFIPVFVPDLADQQMILFGGLSQNASRESEYAQTDTWLFKNNEWSNITTQVSGTPPALIYAVGAYDPDEHGVIVIGTNYPGPPFYSETYLYSAGTWTNLTASVPTPGPTQEAGVFVWDSYVGADILTSSELVSASHNALVDYPVTWAFYEGNWVNLTATAGAVPSGTGAGGTALPDGSIVVFGGTPNSLNFTDYTYDFSLPPVVSSVTANVTELTEGSPVKINATFSGGIAPYVENISWGDGTYLSGSSQATHTFLTTGNFTVEFSVTDFVDRSATGTANLTVKARPSSPPSGGGSLFGGSGLFLLLAVVVIAAIIAVLVLLARRRRAGPGGPAAQAPPPPPAVPPGPGGPPS